MFMQKIRHATTKHRTVLIVVVALLAVGLVGSFAVWGAADSPSSTNTNNMSTMEQIELYESYIAQTLPAEGEQITYDTAGSLAGLYMTLYSLYANAYNETVAEDADLGQEYYDKSIDAAAKAAEYYQLQLDNAAEDIADYVKAGIMGDRAMALACTGDGDAAQAIFDEALALAPNNYDLATNYLSFVYQNEGLEAAQAYAASYMEVVGEESAFYQQMQSQIDYIERVDQAMEEFYKELENLQNQNQSQDGSDADGDTNTAGDGTATDGGTNDDNTADDSGDNAPADNSAN